MEDRDRFILSKGHGPIALYGVLATKGFFPADELGRFMTWDGILGGHPDRPRLNRLDRVLLAAASRAMTRIS